MDNYEDILAELSRKYEADEAARREFQKKHGHIRRPTGVLMDGKIWMAFDGAIYCQEQDGPYNFVNAIHDHALHFFGAEFLDREDQKDLDERHPAIRWLHLHLQAGTTRQNGNGAAWFRFAYDLFTIRDNARLERDLKKRLLSSLTFQAARYELKVAAICATAGFDLSFEDETDNTKKHPEFIGVDRFTEAKIAVEAKSRHRAGVLGFGQNATPADDSRVGIRRNLLDAYRKSSDLPFYVFVDANLPPCDHSTMERWEDELVITFRDFESEGYATPSPANAVFITNDPSHYVGADAIGTWRDSLWVRCYTASAPRVQHPGTDVVERLLVAHKQRVTPPSEFHENP